jgi:DNA-binding HxlR family transcriptional regulator
LLNASENILLWSHEKKARPKRRSGYPLNASVEILGDNWSLPAIRDMMLPGFRTCKEFLERTATNILADRLRKFEAHGIATTEAAKVVLGRSDDIL